MHDECGARQPRFVYIVSVYSLRSYLFPCYSQHSELYIQHMYMCQCTLAYVALLQTFTHIYTHTLCTLSQPVSQSEDIFTVTIPMQTKIKMIKFGVCNRRIKKTHLRKWIAETFININDIIHNDCRCPNSIRNFFVCNEIIIIFYMVLRV